MFEVGDKVVYPNHGIGEIKDVKEIQVSGHVANFFEVYILSSQSTVKVPAGNAKSVGLRKLLGKDDIKDVYEYLASAEAVKYDDWKERFKLNSDLMRTGKIEDMTKVLKNLYFVSLGKPLSFREKRMYERAMQLVASEIAEVEQVEEREIEASLIKQLDQSAEKAGINKDDAE